MSKPIVWTDAPLCSIIENVISAMSALNMYPDPIEGPEDRYLSDGWAKHSMEHLQAVCEAYQAHQHRHERAIQIIISLVAETSGKMDVYCLPHKGDEGKEVLDFATKYLKSLKAK